MPHISFQTTNFSSAINLWGRGCKVRQPTVGTAELHGKVSCAPASSSLPSQSMTLWCPEGGLHVQDKWGKSPPSITQFADGDGVKPVSTSSTTLSWQKHELFAFLYLLLQQRTLTSLCYLISLMDLSYSLSKRTPTHIFSCTEIQEHWIYFFLFLHLPEFCYEFYILNLSIYLLWMQLY